MKLPAWSYLVLIGCTLAFTVPMGVPGDAYLSKGPISGTPTKKGSRVGEVLTDLVKQDALAYIHGEHGDHIEDIPGTSNRSGLQLAQNIRFMPDTILNCGGLCFAVAKQRVDQAYRIVSGKDLKSLVPKDIGNTYLKPQQAFDWIWGVNTQDNELWRSLYGMRGCGSAGAMKLARLGDFKTETQIWKGELTPGAVVQVYVYAADYTKISEGIDQPKAYDNLSSYGHSFIFLDYVRSAEGMITGMRVADQGFLNGKIVPREKFEVWFGANLLDPQ